jgi:hypothetical protein
MSNKGWSTQSASQKNSSQGVQNGQSRSSRQSSTQFSQGLVYTPIDPGKILKEEPYEGLWGKTLHWAFGERFLTQREKFISGLLALWLFGVLCGFLLALVVFHITY